jgi:hypothetical protein
LKGRGLIANKMSGRAARSKAFSQVAKARRKSRIEGNDQLASLIQGYFEGLFTSEVLAPDPGLLGKVNRRVTEEMNASLLAPFTADEVKAAL